MTLEDAYSAGWRPAAGWLAVIGMAWNVMIQPLLAWVALYYGVPTPPSADTDLLLFIFSSLLGLGALRTVEKVKKVS